MKYRLVIYTLLAALLSVSCQKEEKTNSGMKQIGFSASVNATLEYDVKAVEGSQFCEGTHYMGLWICDGAESQSHSYPLLEEFRNTMAEYTRYQDNSEQWNFSGNGRTWQNTIAVNDGAAVDIYSYYPWDGNISDITAIPFTSGETDYLWCEPVKLSSVQTTGDGVLNVQLNYKHVMTCIEVSVKANVNNAILMDEITLTDLSGVNIPTSGTFNAATGEVNASIDSMVSAFVYNNGGNGYMLANDDTTPKLYFIFPQYDSYDANNFELTFKFNGIDGATKFAIPSSITQSGKLETGKKYIVNLQLNEAMKFSVADFKTTDDWNEEIYQTDIEL